MTTKTFKLEILTCPSCTMKIEGAIKKMSGIHGVEVFFNSSKVKVTFDESVQNVDGIKKTIDHLGFKVLGIK